MGRFEVRCGLKSQVVVVVSVGKANVASKIFKTPFATPMRGEYVCVGEVCVWRGGGA